jgi:WW domain-binding protein 2
MKIVYLPSAPTPELQSFSSPILNLQDSYVRAPFFGANYWTALCKPVSGGGIPPDYPSVELKMTFREGGAFDFHSCLEQIKERLYQVYSVAREHGGRGTSGADLVNMDLEQLPAYEAATEVTDEAHEVALDSGVADTTRSSRPETFTAPAEPPPDYEEVQAQAVSVDLDQRLREQAERQ